ncbi:hypothetical protein [Rossellomorea sp. FM04394]|uniref:hypothetical protein n=1 Tax=Rossellomorea sp. FM04394 TaxID=3243076 RepID=UPI0035A6F0FD
MDLNKPVTAEEDRIFFRAFLVENPYSTTRQVFNSTFKKKKEVLFSLPSLHSTSNEEFL